MALPKCVIDARKIDFGLQITGYLCCAEFEPPCVAGVVFCEARGRFVDGTTIRSSRLKRVFELRGTSFARQTVVVDIWCVIGGTRTELFPCSI